MPHVNQLADHLFCREAGKMVSVLTRHFGFAQREIAEDLVQEMLLAALAAWRVSVPDDPTAWLHRVARNKALNFLRRGAHFQKNLRATTLPRWPGINGGRLVFRRRNQG